MTREAMENQLINYAVQDGIAVVELHDPPANTYTYEMMRDLDDAILEARLDADVHVVVIRIAKRGPGMLGLPEINLGLLPGMGGTQRLPRLIGKSRGLEMLATGRTISVEEAHEIGLVNHVFEEENFFEKVLEYAKQFVAPAKASKAVGLIKRSVQTGLEIPQTEALALERELLQQLFESEDAQEGLDAYAKKRQGQFKGK